MPLALSLVYCLLTQLILEITNWHDIIKILSLYWEKCVRLLTVK